MIFTDNYKFLILVLFFILFPIGSVYPQENVENTTLNLGKEQQEELKKHELKRFFLREFDVLSQKGELWAEIGAFYIFDQDDYLLNTYQGLSSVKTTERTFYFPLSVRYGLTDRFQTEMSIPLIRGEQTFKINSTSIGKDEWGVGDLSAGFKFHWLQEKDRVPDTILSLSYTAPTGRSPYDLESDEISFGGGHHAINFSLTGMYTTDPIVSYIGIGTGYFFDKGQFKKDNSYQIIWGTSLMLNPESSVNVLISGDFVGAADDEKGTTLIQKKEIWALTLSWSYHSWKGLFFEPMIKIGLSEDASDIMVGISTPVKLWNP